MAIKSTSTEKYAFAAAAKRALFAVFSAADTVVKMQATMTARGWQTGGADAIVDTDLDGSTGDPNNGGVIPGPCLMMTAATLTTDINTFAAALENFLNGVAVTPTNYMTELNRINPSW
jgi:hypothetical protein